MEPGVETGDQSTARAATLHQFALDTTIRRLTADHSPGSIERVVAKLHKTVPDEAAGPCPQCVEGHFPLGLVCELIPLQRVLEEMTDEATVELARACREYSSGRSAVKACPFQTGAGCLFGENKPFQCRRDPQNHETLTAVELGLATGLCAIGLDHHRVDFAQAIPLMLKDPGWVEDYAMGGHVFWEAGRFPAYRDLIAEGARILTGTREPSGAPADSHDTLMALERMREIPLGVALAPLQRDTTLHRIARLRLPYASSSEAEIDQHRTRYVKELRELASSRLDPMEAFDALRMFDTFALAYQGREVASILTEIGDTLVGPIVKRALPDLAQPVTPRRREGKYRVGYLSPNMRFHNGSYWSLGWIKNHAEDIEAFVIGTGPINDYGFEDFRDAADHAYYLPGDVTETARFIKSLNLDVLIFTDIGMSAGSYFYSGMRLAPVQASAWGHPVTSGLSTVDYYLSSNLMEPINGEDHYREKLVRLPGSGLYLYPREHSGVAKSRADFDLPEGFLAVMPHAPNKLVPREDSFFAKLSESLENPIVFINSMFPAANPVIRARLEKAGVRQQWLARLSGPDFRRVIELADLVLDIPAWNGGNVTVETIGVGKPIVTMPGEFMRGRHGLAFLKQASLESLIAKDEDDYIRIAGDRHLQASAMANADLTGPCEDMEAVRGLDAWIRQVVDEC